MPVSNKEKCICQICICGEHRCEANKESQLYENISKSEKKVLTQSKSAENLLTTDDESSSAEQRERSRRQWETSPDQMKEISKSLSQINGTHSEKREPKGVRNKRSIKEKPIESHPKEPIRPTLPPITPNYSDSDSGKEVINSCICEGMYKMNNECSDSGQWVVSRPVRNRPKDNLRLEGPMEMETTFKTTYESTAKHINDNMSKNVAVVMPSAQNHSEECKGNGMDVNAIKASKKKPKHRPSTSLKAGGDGYFNTINKESYKNFVIIDGKPKTSSPFDGKPSNVCCATVSNIKLPKVDSNHKEDNQTNRRLSREEKATQSMEQMNRSMQRLTTSDRYESRNTQTNDNGCAFADISVQTNNFNDDYETSMKPKAENISKSFGNSYRKEVSNNERAGAVNSWTVASLEEPKRIYTRDVDNIKELGLMDEPNEQMIREIQGISERDKSVRQYHYSSTGMRNESSMSKHFVQSQTRQKKHKNESSMKLFDGDMDFTTTTRAYFADKSPNRGEVRPPERERTAGKRSRKSGRKRNLFRTSTEAQFYEPYGENIGTETTETTYRKQFGDRLYCPAIDLGSEKSEFKYRGEASGHQFFLPAVNN